MRSLFKITSSHDQTWIILWMMLISGFPRTIGEHNFSNETYARSMYYSRDSSYRIVAGVEVPIEIHPYVALLTIYEDINMKICGGSIISHRVVLTAAHCITNTLNGMTIPAEHLKIYLGSSVICEGDRYEVCTAIKHDKYDHRHPIQYYFYDIGLVLLETTIKFGPSVKMIEIASNWRWRNRMFWFTIAGFGKTSNFSTKRYRRRRVLKATKMQYVDTETCGASPTFKDQKMPVPRHMFCMISNKWSSDCYGDSGSGVVWKGYLVGLVCIGRTVFCGSDTIPSMYTDVVYFRGWIVEKLAEIEDLPRDKCERGLRSLISEE